MLRKCTKCGLEFEGSYDSILCRTCAEESIRNVVRIRTCTRCGISFPGYPASKFCPSCSAARKKETNRAYLQRKRNGEARSIGSVDVCAICGAEYTVTGGLQKYCPDCAADAIAENDRKMSRQWNACHVDNDKRNQVRHDAAACIKCAVCGKSFRPAPGGRSTCSPECAKIHSAERYSEWYQANKERLNEYQRNRSQAKLDSMTPEELAVFRQMKNALARDNYRKRKEKNKESEQ